MFDMVLNTPLKTILLHLSGFLLITLLLGKDFVSYLLRNKSQKYFKLSFVSTISTMRLQSRKYYFETMQHFNKGFIRPSKIGFDIWYNKLSVADGSRIAEQLKS